MSVSRWFYYKNISRCTVLWMSDFFPNIFFALLYGPVGWWSVFLGKNSVFHSTFHWKPISAHRCKMLSLNIPHTENMFQVYVIEISKRDKEGGRGYRNAQTVYHQETCPSTHWTGGCFGPTSGLDAFEKKLFPCLESNIDFLVACL